VCVSRIYAVATAAVFKRTLSSIYSKHFSHHLVTIPPYGYLNDLFSPRRGEGRGKQINDGRWEPSSCPSLPPSLPCLLQSHSCHNADVWPQVLPVWEAAIRTLRIEAISSSCSFQYTAGKVLATLCTQQQLGLDSNCDQASLSLSAAAPSWL